VFGIAGGRSGRKIIGVELSREGGSNGLLVVTCTYPSKDCLSSQERKVNYRD